VARGVLLKLGVPRKSGRRADLEASVRSFREVDTSDPVFACRRALWRHFIAQLKELRRACRELCIRQARGEINAPSDQRRIDEARIKIQAAIESSP